MGDSNVDSQMRDTLKHFLPKSLSFYQMLRLWLEEPRLHEEHLYLPSLPPQYNSERLATLMQASGTSMWFDFVPLWEIKGLINTLVQEWIQVASYQKSLPSKSQPHDSSPDNAISRIQKRLKKHHATHLPPSFHCLSSPFTALPEEVLLSPDALMAVVRADTQFIANQASSFCSNISQMAGLDTEFMNGVPELYSNEPRQFHVNVPCRSRFSRQACQGPATIVFRFEEMTAHPKWEQRLKTNRGEYNDLLLSLRSPVSNDLCRSVMRMEHTVAELSKLSHRWEEAEENPALVSGIALFYEILQCVSVETRQFLPSCQFLTSCVQILGQEFVMKDPQECGRVLQTILSISSVADLLAPIFQPNRSSGQFLSMYSCVLEAAVTQQQSIVFSILTKFNITSWLEASSPSQQERVELLDLIMKGFVFCGPEPLDTVVLFQELYRNHFKMLVGHKFPCLLMDALKAVVKGSRNHSILPLLWADLCTLLKADTMRENEPNPLKSELEETMHVGGILVSKEPQIDLGTILACLRYLSDFYAEERKASQRTLFSILSHDYVRLIGHFVGFLCELMVERWRVSVEAGGAAMEEAVTECWQNLLDVFSPWIFSMQLTDSPEIQPPCTILECEVMKDFVQVFVSSVYTAQSKLNNAEDPNFMCLLWQYYCSSLAVHSTPDHVIQVYHSCFTSLPWGRYTPDLAAIHSMSELKLRSQCYPSSCFHFLGTIFHQFNWTEIVRCTTNDIGYSGNTTRAIQLHIMLLQLLVMLTSEEEVMKADDSGIPDLMAEAHSFHWEYVDFKTYNDILQWQKNNCDCAMVLHTGSSLCLSLRLLKVVAGFPTSSGRRERLHPETREKRLAYISTVVELVAGSTHKKGVKASLCSDAVSQLFQTVIDICVHEPEEQGTAHIISLLQEILNLLNTCSPAQEVTNEIVRHMMLVLDQMPDAHLLTLPTITAGCRVLASLKLMTQVVEHAILCHFKALATPPNSHSHSGSHSHSDALELPRDVNDYGWHAVVVSLVAPESALEEFSQTCVGECALLTLHGHTMQNLRQCASLVQEHGLAVKLVRWSTQIKPLPTQEGAVFPLWEKALYLLVRQLTYSSSSHTSIVPHLTTMAASLAHFGEDKASEGILGVIGLGKKSCYSHRFRLISRVMSTFLYCQMPVDPTYSTHLRLTPDAPGHLTTHTISTTQTHPQHVTPAKLAEQGHSNLEALLSNKAYVSVKEQITYSLSFINDPSNTLKQSTELLVCLCTRLYGDCRYLDVLRVPH